MLSSRVSLAVGTLSLVAVTSVSTAVLINDGAQRLVEPPVVAAPHVAPPVFRAPPLVVPETPGTVVTRPAVRRLAPQQEPADVDVVAAPDRAVVVPEPVPTPEPPVAAPPITKDPVLYPPLYEPPVLDLPGKGKHRGLLKETGRDKGHAKGPKHRKG